MSIDNRLIGSRRGIHTWLVALVVLGSLLAGGCAGAESPVEVGAANGNVVIADRPERIVSLSPTATEMLFAIGAGSQVVAVDQDSDYPAGVPTTGLNGVDPNVEALAAYRPDLIVYANEPGRLQESLDALGVPALFQPAAGSLDDAYAQILRLGRVTGHSEEAQDVVEEMKERIAGIVESSVRPAASPSYYHELDGTFFTATSSTFIGQIYGLLGLVNIADPADQLGSGYPQLSAEYIIGANPDFIFLADARCCGESAETVGARPGWDQIEAVRQGRVVELDDDVASRWGPRVVELLGAVARALEEFDSVS